jgi:cytosine permease
MTNPNLEETIEDHALEPVPDAARRGWLALSWNTAGLATTLIQLFFGALATFVAGFRVALLAGVIVTVIGTLLGWGCGHVAFRTGMSSTVMSRHLGFGRRGSIISSLIFGFMIIGFLALENALLYNGYLFYFRQSDTLLNEILVYGALTVLWVVLTTYGFGLVARVSSVTLVAFLLVLLYMSGVILAQSGRTGGELVSFPSQIPAAALAGMGIRNGADKFVFALNLLIRSAGALALVDADIGRYARRSRDIGIAALIGSVTIDIVVLALGGILVYAGEPRLTEFYIRTGMSDAAAHQATLQSPASIAAAFIIFGGATGAILMVLAQAKAQVLNTYSASLSLSNLFDNLGWRPGRFTFVVLGNLIGLVMLYGQILALVNSWITVLGVTTTAFAGIMVTDYFVVRRMLGLGRAIDPARVETVNWAGVIATVVAVAAAHYGLVRWIPVEFFSSFVIATLGYTALRTTVFRPAAIPAVAVVPAAGP